MVTSVLLCKNFNEKFNWARNLFNQRTKCTNKLFFCCCFFYIGNYSFLFAVSTKFCKVFPKMSNRQKSVNFFCPSMLPLTPGKIIFVRSSFFYKLKLKFYLTDCLENLGKLCGDKPWNTADRKASLLLILSIGKDGRRQVPYANIKNKEVKKRWKRENIQQKKKITFDWFSFWRLHFGSCRLAKEEPTDQFCEAITEIAKMADRIISNRISLETHWFSTWQIVASNTNFWSEQSLLNWRFKKLKISSCASEVRV